MKKLIDEGKLILDKKGEYQKKQDFSSSGASIDLALGEDVFITPNETPSKLLENEIINIEPGQFAALITEERLFIPEDYLGFITIRFKYKSKGLVNISGFHVDPGFKGRLVFSAYNIGPSVISLRRKEKIFSLFLAKIEKGAKYEGDFLNETGIPIHIVESLASAKGPSIHELDGRVKDQESRINLMWTIIIGIVLAVIGSILSKFIEL